MSILRAGAYFACALCEHETQNLADLTCYACGGVAHPGTCRVAIDAGVQAAPLCDQCWTEERVASLVAESES